MNEELLDRALRVLEKIETLLPGEMPAIDANNYHAFRWHRHGYAGHLLPVAVPADISLADLQCIERQMETIDRNTRQFLHGVPANHALLWGPRGTGKSSLIKALLNEYRDRGLRLIEVGKDSLADLPEIIESLRKLSYYFIIYCDDLSFAANDPGFKSLKVLVDGSIASTPDNVLIYATSNRRHLVPESMEENRQSQIIEGELHLSEAIEEKISLSERFGMWLAFHPFNQDQYLQIVDYWLKQLQVASINEQVHKAALRWALEHGSRSGRSAWQFARDWCGRQQLEQVND